MPLAAKMKLFAKIRGSVPEGWETCILTEVEHRSLLWCEGRWEKR